MLILTLEEARPGMTLAAPVPHPELPEQILLKRGYALEESVIARLRAMGVAQLFVDYPALDELDRHLAPFLSPARQQVYLQIKKSITAAQKSSVAAVRYADYASSTRELITTLLDQGQNPIFLEQMARSGGDAVAHATSVAHLALVLGLRLENYLIEQRRRLSVQQARDVVNLGVAAMLHDIGKCRLPEALRPLCELDAPADAGALDEWRTHAHLGWEMIREEVEPTAAAAVLHHHQHFDGSGFPTREGSGPALERERIHIFARIVQAADLYDRLATTAQTGARRANLEILHLMRSRYAAWVDPVVLKTLEAVAPPFPPGSRLQLSDGTEAVVMRFEDPYFPHVRRIVGEPWTLAPEMIDLRCSGAPAIRAIGRTAVDLYMPHPRALAAAG